MSFGLVNGNQLTYTDSGGLHTLPTGEARGLRWQWQIDFDASSGTYSGVVTNMDNSLSTFSFSGNLQLSNTTAGSFAVINTSSGGNQNLIFNNAVFSVPEPSSLGLAGASALGLFTWSRRRRLVELVRNGQLSGHGDKAADGTLAANRLDRHGTTRRVIRHQ